MENRDGTQNIAGDENIQIMSGNDSIAAIGERSIAAGGDVIINHGIPLEEHAHLLAKNKILEEKLAKLNEKHHHELEVLQNDSAKVEREAQAKAVIEFYQEHLDREGIEFSPEKHLELADAAILAGELDVGIKNYTSAMEKFALVNNHKMEARIMVSLGPVYTMQSKLEMAEAWLTKGYEITKRIGDKQGTSRACSNLSVVEYTRGNHAKATQYLLEALEISKSLNDEFTMAAVMGNLGNISSEKGDYDVAENHYKKALQIYRNLNAWKEIASVADNLGGVARERKQFEESYAHHMESYLIRVKIGDKIGQLYCILNMSVLSLEVGNFEQGRTLLTEALNMSRKMGVKNIEGLATRNLASLAQREGNQNRYRELVARIKEIESETGLSFLD